MRKKVRFNRIFDSITENLLRMSGAVTGITILFISFFLFSEGIPLFSNKTIEQGYGLYVHKDNPVNQLTPMETKQIFDGEKVYWSDFGGEKTMIKPFRIDDIFDLYAEREFGDDYEKLPEKLGEVLETHPNIIAFLPLQYAPQTNVSKELIADTISLRDYFLEHEWMPTATPAPLLGVMPLVLGTLLVSFVALLIAVPLGLGVAVFLSELASVRQRAILKPIIELLAGIPSVVYGFFGLVVLAPLVQKTFGLPVGETALTGSLILAIMALPTIISVAEDALRNTPSTLREASLALGASPWQTIYKVIIPYAKSGISAAVVLGIGRAIGETMAVLMVTGNAALIPHSIMDPVRTIPATIAAELGEAPAGGAHYQALFLLGCILFVMTSSISLSSELISRNKNRIKS